MVAGNKVAREQSTHQDTPEPSLGDLLDVVIVNYNSFDDTLKCVSQLINQREISAQNIHIIDNYSPDGSGEQLREALPLEVNVILSQENNGFGAGVNIGTKAGRAPFILILNPDCYPAKANIFLVLEHFSRHADIGIIGADLISPDGSLQYSARTFYSGLDILIRRSFLKSIFPFNMLNESHLMKRHPRHAAFDVDWVMGTGMFVRRHIFEDVGKMNEAYFLYMEDVDLCARVHEANYRVQLLPTVQFIHDHRRQSASSLRWTRAHSEHVASLRTFAKRYGLPLFHRPVIRKHK